MNSAVGGSGRPSSAVRRRRGAPPASRRSCDHERRAARGGRPPPARPGTRRRSRAVRSRPGRRGRRSGGGPPPTRCRTPAAAPAASVPPPRRRRPPVRLRSTHTTAVPAATSAPRYDWSSPAGREHQPVGPAGRRTPGPVPLPRRVPSTLAENTSTPRGHATSSTAADHRGRERVGRRPPAAARSSRSGGRSRRRLRAPGSGRNPSSATAAGPARSAQATPRPRSLTTRETVLRLTRPGRRRRASSAGGPSTGSPAPLDPPDGWFVPDLMIRPAGSACPEQTEASRALTTLSSPFDVSRGGPTCPRTECSVRAGSPSALSRPALGPPAVLAACGGGGSG